MNNDEEVRIGQLRGVFTTAFEFLSKDLHSGMAYDLAGEWARIVGGTLDNVLLQHPPHLDGDHLPFSAPHRVTTERFTVAAGGMAGGPVIDLLLQMWFDTEDVDMAFGVPLMIRPVASFGPMHEGQWRDMRDTARLLMSYTPSGRFVFIGNREQFDLRLRHHHLLDETPLYAIDSNLMAGMKHPPRGMAGSFMGGLVRDLACGWIGDAGLSGRGDEELLSDFLKVFHVSPWKTTGIPSLRRYARRHGTLLKVQKRRTRKKYGVDAWRSWTRFFTKSSSCA